MDMRNIVEKHPILAIMRNVPMEKAIDYADAVIKGGINIFEISLNSKDAYKQIHILRNKFDGKALFGAGTAITLALAKQALDSGAQFLLTPSTHEDILSYCQENNIFLLPGVFTPTDVAVCMRYGFKTMKLFPAENVSDHYIKNLKGPFDGSEYVAIGGITADNIKKFFDCGYIGVGLGSNLIPKNFVIHNEWDKASSYVSGLVQKIL